MEVFVWNSKIWIRDSDRKAFESFVSDNFLVAIDF